MHLGADIVSATHAHVTEHICSLSETGYVFHLCTMHVLRLDLSLFSMHAGSHLNIPIDKSI